MANKQPDAVDVAKLTESQAKAELKRLAAEIAAHDKRYYQDDAPTVSDAEYDALRRRNAAIEARFPDLVLAESPSTRLGAENDPLVLGQLQKAADAADEIADILVGEGVTERQHRQRMAHLGKAAHRRRAEPR